jgi:hypothetical protein
MEHHSMNKDADHYKRILEGQLRECYGRVVYSHKTHEKCADILLERLSQIKFWQIVLSALSTGGFISFFLGSGEIGAAIGLILSTILFGLNTYTKNYDLGELAQKHKQAANEIWVVREKYLSLLTDLAVNTKTVHEITDERDLLLDKLNSAYIGSPSTNFKAYAKAQDALKTKEDLTFTDEEIDAFLPSDLRRSK